MAELHSTFHPLMRIRCATPACTEARTGLSSYSILCQSWESGNYNSSSYTKSSSITIIRLLCCSSTAYPSLAQKKKKKLHKAHLYLFCAQKMLSSAVKKTIKYTCLQTKKPSLLPLLQNTRHQGELSLINHLKILLRLSKARLLLLPTLNR